MRSDLKQTFKFLGYIVFMTMFMIVGIVYMPLKWLTHKCADYEA